jgi:gamma-glutamyltranspeptidase/glutathione hydrolase
MRYRASITAAVIFGGLAIAVGSATAQKRYDPGASEGNMSVGSQFWPHQSRQIVYATHGMVASAVPKASLIGLEVLKEGGTAVDAAIAVNAYLGFIEPTMCGPGGDLFAIVWNESNDKYPKGLYGLNASGRSPHSLTIDAVKSKYGKDINLIPVSKPESWTVPGAVDGWFALHHRFGQLPMTAILQPAIDAAETGEPVPGVIASNWQWPGWYDVIKKNAGFSETFLPNGRPPAEGEVFQNLGLAETYRQIATAGRDAFYRGDITRKILKYSQQNGGYFQWKDFDRNDHAEWVSPISTDYRGYTVWELPPNGQGLAVLQLLNILKTYDFKSLGWTHDHPDFWHTFIEAKKLVYEDIAKYYADPKVANVPVNQLLSQERALQLKKLITDRANVIKDLKMPELPRVLTGDTTYITVADKYGNMVSLIESNYRPFGSGYTVAGFPLQDRGALFSLNPDSPNSLEPDKRPFHTLIPALVTRNGRPWLSFGVMGGSTQPEGQTEVLVNLIDFGMNLQAAGDALRIIHSVPTGADGAPPSGFVYAEHGFSQDVLNGLSSRGHVFLKPDAPFYLKYTGGFQGIIRDPVTGVYSGASDARKDGVAIGY